MKFLIAQVELNPGPFAPLVGYVGAIIATVYLIGIIWRGRRLGLWQSPEEDLPRTAQNIVGVICGIGIVGLWLYATPNTLQKVFWLAIVFGVALLIAYVLYAFLIGVLTYDGEKANDDRRTTHPKKIIGGIWLKKEAKRAMKEHRVRTIQNLLRGAAYDPDELWDRTSRGIAKTILLLLFLTIMVSGTLGISSAGFAVQVRLTDKPAAAVILPEEAPGSQPEIEKPQ